MTSDIDTLRRVVRSVFPDAQVSVGEGDDCEEYVVTGTAMFLHREKRSNDGDGPKSWTVQKTVYWGGSMDEPPGYDAVDVTTAVGITHAAAALVEAMASEAAWAEIEKIGIDEQIAEQISEGLVSTEEVYGGDHAA